MAKRRTTQAADLSSKVPSLSTSLPVTQRVNEECKGRDALHDQRIRSVLWTLRHRRERILISSDWGEITAELADNEATRSLAQMLPLTIAMRDHHRQEKTGNLPSPLPAVERQLDSPPAHWDSGAPITL
jgi:hypothetical protein